MRERRKMKWENIKERTDLDLGLTFKGKQRHGKVILLLSRPPQSNVMYQRHPAGTVLPFSSYAFNVTTRIGDRVYMC